MPLAILTIRKELHGFPFLCIRVVPFSIIMGLRLAALLGGPSGRRSSANISTKSMFSYITDILSETITRDVRLDKSWQNSLYMNVVLSQLQSCSIKVALQKKHNNHIIMVIHVSYHKCHLTHLAKALTQFCSTRHN